ncbi:hypothetical protein CEP54_005624 [Fusarium duplospermum]|uniref:Uncharacterized protein n=1 Tax=Fusarium duplospermum TaxID=1325734 RepID=A0A428QBN4_9HYPO|nr:hypothetical protein CEP54_005624 [Fusarium duplospermum]
MDQKRSRSCDQANANSLYPPKRQKTMQCHSNDALPHNRYTIAWICALHIEMAAARAMLDEIHPDLPQDVNDKNTYMLGSIGSHNIVIACLPNGHYGTNNAASVSTHLQRSFPSIRNGLMVGIGGGVPSRADIRLGDVVIGTEVTQYDLGKIVEGGKIQVKSGARIPDSSLSTAVSAMRTRHEGEPSRVSSILQNMVAKNPNYGYPKSPDRLFLASYKHKSQLSPCSDCDQSKLLPKSTREPNNPKIHYGGIASGNQVMKDSITRDEIAQELGIMCFEMEAAGLMGDRPYLPIRGICDYADSHKSKEWQRYAAATAAAYAKELIETLPANKEAVEDSYIGNYQSLKFDQIDSRKISIKKAHLKTCRWFLKHPRYLEWLDPQNHAHRGFLWIRGKPGAGKSTIMKFIYEQTKKNNLHKHAITASFFFHARGEDLQKSIPGMYRSLLLQLLEGYPDLQEVLDDTDLVPRGQIECPSLNVLKDLFHNAVSNLGQRTFACFIDALDECDEQQVMEMVRYFDELAESCEGPGSHLQICFSSRHYPHIQMRHGIELTLEHQQGHLEDMSNYIQKNLLVKPPALAERLRSQMLKKAAGVFLWVVLVVDILNKESRRGGLALQKRLAEVPSGLSDLFKDILTRDTDNMEDLLLSVLWILYAKRPLRPEEYCHALWSGLVQKDLVDPEMPDTGPDSSDCIRSYVIASSKGLAEIPKVKSPTRYEYPLLAALANGHKDAVAALLGLESSIWEGVDIAEGFGAKKDVVRCKGRTPLTWAAQEGQMNVLKPLLQKGIDIDETDQQDYTSLMRASEAGHHAIASLLIKEGARVDSAYSRQAMSLSLENGHVEIVKLLIGANAGLDLDPDILQRALNTASRKGFEPMAKYLLEEKADVHGPKCYTALCQASKNGQLAIVKLLLKRGLPLELDATDRILQSALIKASRNGHEAIVRFLVEQGANIEAPDAEGRTALAMASMNGHEGIARFLVLLGADIESRDSMGATPLHLAASRKYVPAVIIKFLIVNGADVHARDREGSSPLHLAINKPDHPEWVVGVLVKNGADVDARNHKGDTPRSLVKEMRLGAGHPLALTIEGS